MPLSPLVTTVWIDVRTLGFIESTALDSPRLETGGALFGWSDDVGVVIAYAFGPGPAAVRTRSTLLADPDYTEEAIRGVHVASEGRYHFLGSWHSHPGGAARPSATDALTASTIAGDLAVRLPRPTLVVVGLGRRRRFRRTGGCPHARAFVWDSVAHHLQEAVLVTTELSDRYCPP